MVTPLRLAAGLFLCLRPGAYLAILSDRPFRPFCVRANIMAVKKKKAEEQQIEIQEIEVDEVEMNFLGTSPMIMNRFASKAWRELLFPSVKQNRAGLEQSLKHDPPAEYRGALYVNRSEKEKTLFHVPSGAFHGALASVAIDIPGSAKAKIERLTKIVDLQINLYGVPSIFCAMVRNSDQNRTPDVRTRPIFPEWCGTIRFRYMRGILTEKTVVNLFGAAGKIIGIGDWRGQKGGPYGAYDVVGTNNADWNRIIKTQARVAQERAFKSPAYFDENTRELLEWFHEEVARREMDDQLVSADGHKLETAKGRRKPMPKGLVHITKVDGKGEEAYGGVD